MLILFDNGTPAPLRYALKGHIVVEALERGWDRLGNGELIAAEGASRRGHFPGNAVYRGADVTPSDKPRFNVTKGSAMAKAA
jgi:hypothetical protein